MYIYKDLSVLAPYEPSQAAIILIKTRMHVAPDSNWGVNWNSQAVFPTPNTNNLRSACIRTYSLSLA
ncbi:hypothetical protein ACTXT7_013645 [Hymenolepis weldensis]